MNKRIQELVGQAKFMAEETINKQISKNAELDAFAEKFTELIVRECAGISEQHNRNYYTSHGQIIADKIKQHFGVE